MNCVFCGMLYGITIIKFCMGGRMCGKIGNIFF
jgi:hypothetical protein